MTGWSYWETDVLCRANADPESDVTRPSSDIPSLPSKVRPREIPNILQIESVKRSKESKETPVPEFSPKNDLGRNGQLRCLKRSPQGPLALYVRNLTPIKKIILTLKENLGQSSSIIN